ncbi:polysaccharide pyruvyl transferase family protein [Prosthecobacter sp.]|uniref:polysaccharide pyruvyl transferase family protein n=1 Tax=Prosthecobacter sp. TaxID=1965333 RepID=UPI0037851AF0
MNHNVGDDFVRMGIISLLQSVLGDFHTTVIHKHFPAAVRGRLWQQIDRMTRGLSNRFDWRARLSRVVDFLPSNAARDQVLSCDLLVQSGAPMYWKNRWSTCAQTEWFAPLVEKRWRQISLRAPLLNLGAGSCQAWGSDGSEIVSDPDCHSFIDRFTRWSSLTTVRDKLAHSIVSQCGHDVPLLPCPAIFAPGALNIEGRPGQYIALNYMPYGGHYDLADRGAEARQKWETVFCKTAHDLARQHACLLICHDRTELQLAQRLLPEIPRFHSDDWRDYLHAYSRCSSAVVNRVHGAVVAAVMGKQVLLTGNDTRLLMAAEVPGVTVHPVQEVWDSFDERVADLLRLPAREQPAAFLETTRSRYLELLRPILSA